MPDVEQPDFKLIEAYDDKIASQLVMQIAKRLYDKSVNFQVLSPRHAGDAGVTNLNEMLRLAINPPSGSRAERNLAGSVVREGDRIMVVKNDYERSV